MVCEEEGKGGLYVSFKNKLAEKERRKNYYHNVEKVQNASKTPEQIEKDKKYHHDYSKANIERTRIRKAEYKKNNHPKMLEAYKKYRTINKEEISRKNRDRYQMNRRKILDKLHHARMIAKYGDDY